MKFWKELMEKLEDIVSGIKEMRSDLLMTTDPIDRKLISEVSYISNERPIKTVKNLEIIILDENLDRNKLVIQNIGLEPCYLKLGNEVSKESFHFVLAPDTSPSFGNGGSINLDNWHGEVYAIAEKETKLSVLEY